MKKFNFRTKALPCASLARDNDIVWQMKNITQIFKHQRYHKRELINAIAAIALVIFNTQQACAETRIAEEEYLLLPEYCKAQGNVSETYYKKYYSAERTRQWQSALGKNYDHYHHFCWGIVSIVRAYKVSATYGNRVSLANNAISDINYAVERASPDFILLPAIYTKLGEAYLLAHDDKNAEIAFRKAWEINPAYWRPYVWWSQRLMQLGKLREALLVAEEGQKNAPDVKALDNLIKDIHSANKTGKK